MTSSGMEVSALQHPPDRTNIRNDMIASSRQVCPPLCDTDDGRFGRFLLLLMSSKDAQLFLASASDTKHRAAQRSLSASSWHKAKLLMLRDVLLNGHDSTKPQTLGVDDD